MTRAMFVTGSMCHGGAERHSITIMNRLAERGHECHAICIKSDTDQFNRIHTPEGASVLCLGATRYFDAAALGRFAAHMARIEPAVMVAANPYALMYASLATRLSRRRVPLIVTFHSNRLLGIKEQLQMLAYRPLFWAADRLVFVCENQKRYWMNRGVLSRSNEVIYNGVNTDHFSIACNAQQRGLVRAALGFRDSDYVIGLSAVLRPEKNHLQLVDAIGLLRARGLPAKALIIGDGPMRAAIEIRARERGVEDDVVICGFQNDVRSYVAACDVMTLCSFTEAFSLAAIESMALGKPVVHSDVGGAFEMIVPGLNGYLFPVGDTGALVAKLALLTDRVVSERMGNNARQMVETLFSEQAMVDRYEQTLLEVCATGLRPGTEVPG